MGDTDRHIAQEKGTTRNWKREPLIKGKLITHHEACLYNFSLLYVCFFVNDKTKQKPEATLFFFQYLACTSTTQMKWGPIFLSVSILFSLLFLNWVVLFFQYKTKHLFKSYQLLLPIIWANCGFSAMWSCASQKYLKTGVLLLFLIPLHVICKILWLHSSPFQYLASKYLSFFIFHFSFYNSIIFILLPSPSPSPPSQLTTD